MIAGLLPALLRFSRPGGTPVFAQADEAPPRRAFFQGLAERLDDPGLMTVIDWWFPSRLAKGNHSPPPLPAQSRSDRVLAILRANWSKEGDFAAVDHRATSVETQFELFGLGRRWLGPGWSTGSTEGRPGRARPVAWMSHGSADFQEWSFRVGKGRLTRSIALLRGRRIALLSELWEGPGDPGSFRIQMPEDVVGAELTECRGLSLISTRPSKSIRVYPLCLPCSPYATERGSLSLGDGELILKQATTGPRSFRSILVSWEPLRHRRPVDWRALTISEEGKEIGPEKAFAARFRWGRDDTLLIYRNHGKPATRAFLGHQTRARILVGLFNQDGTVQPLLKVEDEVVANS